MEEQTILELKKLIKDLEVITRVNNLLLSRFILELGTVRKDLGLPKRCTFFRFELLQEEYDKLVQEFGKYETDKALYRLDRTLAQNKQQCPHNIGKYIRRNKIYNEKIQHKSKQKSWAKLFNK